MKKVTDLKENEVILVQTEEEDLAIRTLMHVAGLRWWDGYSYIEFKRGEKYPKGYLPKDGTWDYPDNLGDRYTIYPASDFLESSLEFLTDQLKKLAESKGMKAEIVLSTIDIWDGVEFCKHVSGKHYKIDRIENQYIFTSDGSVLIDANCEPVSEEIVNWLKKEFEDRGVPINKAVKWDERVEENEMIKVKWISSCVDSVSMYFGFEVDGDHGLQYGDEAGKYLAKKLQKHLNRKK